MSVVTRFAPSPTGYLHIGGARTALFNWLFARHHGGKFLLRIEDTDRARSTPAAIQAILDGMRWLGLDWDEPETYQSARAERHAEVAYKLLEQGRAYRCYASKEELEEMRQKARAEGRPIRYDGRWRDRDPAEAPADVTPVVRIKMPLEGETVIEDRVQGQVTVNNEQLDDMVLLRADGSPTYMLSVVVDDHDMGVTHVIRGDDHLTNAFRQYQLYRAMDWEPPVFAHIPLIHGPDGAKMSKRHGAVGLEAYREQGYLPEALRNYLLRLGWGHGDVEIISTEEAVRLFDLDGVGRSAARFDFDKLANFNGHYIREAEDSRLTEDVTQRLESRLGRSVTAEERGRLLRGMDGLKQRAKTLVELAENAEFYVARPQALTPKAAKQLDDDARGRLARLQVRLDGLDDWSETAIEEAVRRFAEDEDLKLGKVAQPLRAALTGSTVSPGIFEVMAVLGRTETLARLAAQAAPAEA
ncbi:glutamate--tRNA ligase [Ferruginivarius sediminum]|uniref:Glutamate--tRNA ligase n=1 Tax=Ferruginivarius sediminum TaxID=2661937 RepID=A0A369TC75_9PROT|nr:glutamate--tRNA ligase [Ferruginivarius sediminum]RDD62124.1 glutamate--tRNA ligase [Ferruginivarius sediminum]